MRLMVVTRSWALQMSAVAKDESKDDRLVRLGADGGRLLRFPFALGETDAWQPIGGSQDAMILSDEFVEMHDPIPTFGFTGAFVGMATWDRGITGCPAPVQTAKES
jgi:hypothetical protein